MTRLSAFFKEGDTELGVFYPKHYLLAVFPNLTEAEHAKENLSKAGCGGDQVISASGEEVLDFAEDHMVRHGIWGALMRELSRLFGTEEIYNDSDLRAAKKGAALVAVHCPTDEQKTTVWKFLEPLHPMMARYYSFGGIEHLAGES